MISAASVRHPGPPSVRTPIGIRLREVLEQEEIALEHVESAMAKLLAEKVESARL